MKKLLSLEKIRDNYRQRIFAGASAISNPFLPTTPKNMCNTYFYIILAPFLNVGKIKNTLKTATGVFLLTSALNISNPKFSIAESSFAQSQKSQKPKTEQVQKKESSITKEKYLKNLSVMMKQGWEKAQDDFKTYYKLKTPSRFKATFAVGDQPDEYEISFYLVNDSTFILIKVLTENSVSIEIDQSTNQSEQQFLSKNQVNEMMAFAYLELLAQKLGLDGIGLFAQGNVSLLYSRLYNKSETMRQCYSEGEPIVAFFSLIFEKQNMDFLKAYIKQDNDTIQKVLDSYLGQNTRKRLLTYYTGKSSSLFEAFINEVAQNGLLVQLIKTMQNKFQSDPMELSVSWDEQNQRFVILRDMYEALKNHQK